VIAAPQQRQERLRHPPGAQHIGLERLLDHAEISVDAALPRVVVNSGVVDQRVESAVAFVDLVHRVLDGFRVRHVQRHDFDVTAVARSRCGLIGGVRLVARPPDVARTQQGDVASRDDVSYHSQADAPVAAGHQDDAGHGAPSQID
jgi:hypothetical protein